MRIGTLFSGIGAPEQGAKRVYGDDLELIFACEFDKFARESFQANYEITEDHFHIDVNDMDGTQYKGKVDIIIGGSPCQAFSIAGLREGLNDKRGQLIWQYYRIIMEAQPDIFIYENVKGMVSDNNGNTLKDFLDVFRESGYFCHHAVLNTKDYGVPQNRERIYIVGFKDHELYHRFQFAPKIKLEKRLKDILDSEVDEKYYLSDEALTGLEKHKNRHQEAGNGFGAVYKTKDEISPTIKARYYKDGNECLKKEPKIIEQLKKEIKKNPNANVFQKTDSRTMTSNIDEIGTLQAARLDKVPFYKDTSLREVVDSIIKDSVTRIRKLTPRECLRLQDFPDTFTQVVSNSQQYKQAGNSMSVNILEMIFRQIEKSKENEPTNTLMDFIS